MAQCPRYRRPPGELYYINRFLKPGDRAIELKAREIEYRLRQAGEDNELNRITEAFNFVSIEIEYVYDEVQFGFTDYWQLPSETLRSKKGDCEDTSFLLASLLLALRINQKRVRVVLGRFREDGHAWVEVFVGNKWYILESTADDPLISWFERDWNYSPEIEVYYNGCRMVGNLGTYRRYRLLY